MGSAFTAAGNHLRQSPEKLIGIERFPENARHAGMTVTL
jgi:hypothetical protein